MPEYLSKEEVKQWRSSLEKITLEEFAARLGKTIEEEKHTNDLVDMVLKGKPFTSSIDMAVTRVERISSIAERASEREHQITNAPHIQSQPIKKDIKAPAESVAKEIREEHAVKKPIEVKSSNVALSNNEILKEEVQIVFKKTLTDREQMVFDFFVKNKNKIVYAKDLAVLLSLPRDYVYKYIKNLRAKIDGENLRNADSGGFMLSL